MQLCESRLEQLKTNLNENDQYLKDKILNIKSFKILKVQPCGPRLEPSIQECDQRGISSSLSGDTKPIIIQSLSGLHQVLSVFQVCIKDKIIIIFHVIVSIVIIIVVIIIIPITIITTMVNNG